MPPFHEQIVEVVNITPLQSLCYVIQLIPDERTSARIEEQFVDVPVPQIQGQIVSVLSYRDSSLEFRCPVVFRSN